MADPLAFLVGPTGTGKTALALEIAERARAAVVSMDSMQVYRGMDIGTAKPSREEQQRVPHFLLDRAEPSERYDVQRYLVDVEAALREIRAQGLRALVVGGTGFYLKALVYGLVEGPTSDESLREELRARVEAEGPSALHSELRAVDPLAAARIHPHDEKRVIRALEVYHGTGRALSEWQDDWGWDGRTPVGRPRTILGLSLELSELDHRIRERTKRMLDAGWVEEAVRIRDGVGFGPTSSQALGYREVLDLALGKLSREDAERAIALRTRQFARKQRTWLRQFPELRWIEGSGEEAVREALEAFGWA